jgi:Mg2+ and Co2+ transporter CorA
MNDAIERAAAAFRQAITRAIVPLQTMRGVSLRELAELEERAVELVRVLEGHALVPKALLKELHVAARVLRNEAPSLGSERGRVEAAAAKLESCLDMILNDEGPDERVPGVPRIR